MGREYPEYPLVGVGSVVIEGGRILLVQRGHAPGKGKWSIPGGLVEVGEKLAEAVKRETFEETGLVVEPGELATVGEAITPDADGRVQFHYVLLDFFVRPTGGGARAGSDVSEVRWVDRGEALALDLTAGVRAFLEELIERGRL
ncbi:MAG TPA: NUDIX hydrolase [Bacillota bacterium]